MKKLFLLPIIFIAGLLLTAQNPAHAYDPSGNYLVLNGGYVKTTTPADSESYTFDFSALIYPNSVSGKQVIFSVGDKAGQKLHYEVGINGGTLYANYFYDANSQRYIAVGKLRSGEWNRIEVYLKNHLENISINGTTVYYNSHEAPFNIKNLGPNVVLGSSYLEPFSSANNFKGLIDTVVLNHEVYTSGVGSLFTQFIYWPLDEPRGDSVAHDASVNKFDGTLVGGDSLIHFYGVLPSPTPYSFAIPTISWRRPVLPTLPVIFPASPAPTNVIPPGENPTPTTFGVRGFPRPTLRLRVAQ